MNHVMCMHESVVYINEHLKEKISLDDLARKAFLSRYYFHRLFSQYIGQSVCNYISAKRMECAAKELIETDCSIMEIAMSYQYGSQEAFSRAFKRTYQMTPGRYRKMFASRKQNNIVYFQHREKRAENRAA